VVRMIKAKILGKISATLTTTEPACQSAHGHTGTGTGISVGSVVRNKTLEGIRAEVTVAVTVTVTVTVTITITIIAYAD
jgi:hypothetical protein